MCLLSFPRKITSLFFFPVVVNEHVAAESISAVSTDLLDQSHKVDPSEVTCTLSIYAAPFHAFMPFQLGKLTQLFMN